VGTVVLWRSRTSAAPGGNVKMPAPEGTGITG
jgi:hypothetical protein